eukprot:scaffold103927_cov47-Prasinocladus_malaysianus.AAC.1
MSNRAYMFWRATWRISADHLAGFALLSPGLRNGCPVALRGEAANFFVAGKSLPLSVAALTLASQSLDSNALLGNAELSYRYHFFDGAALPIGLGLSLLLNAAFLARHINRSNALTLPEIYGNHYGPLVE